MSEHIRDLIEASSLGTPAAKAARASVSDETAARVVARARELADIEAAVAAIWDEWNRAEHDGGCGGIESYCALHCPVPAHASMGLDGLAESAARAVLASDWLAAYIAAQQADLIAAITALRDRARDPKHGGLATVHEITALLPEEHR